MGSKSFSAPDIKERNIRVVFTLARLQETLLRSDISQATGMTPPTVMKIVQSFQEKKILIDVGEASTRLGRKPKRLVFNPGAALAIGALFEGEIMHVGLVDLSGTVIDRISIPMDHAYTADTLPLLVEAIGKLSSRQTAPILGIGLGMPGVVDSDRNIIEFAPLIGIIKPFDCNDLIGTLQNQTRLPVCLENDVNAAAIGEFHFRKLTEEDDLLYIAVGTGIGAGIILNGNLRRGSRNLAGELGYAIENTGIQVKRDLPGWLESQIGLASLQKKFNWQGYQVGGTVPDGLVDFIGDHLAPLVANLTTQLDIKLVVLGGRAIDAIGQPLFDALAKRIEWLSLEKGLIEQPCCTDAGVAGAAMQMISRQLDHWLNS